MPKLIECPTVIEAAGTPPKRIEEYTGRVNTGDDKASVALTLYAVRAAADAGLKRNAVLYVSMGEESAGMWGPISAAVFAVIPLPRYSETSALHIDYDARRIVQHKILDVYGPTDVHHYQRTTCTGQNADCGYVTWSV